MCSENVEGLICGRTFKRKADLVRHTQCVHYAETAKIWYCDAPRCDRNKNGQHGAFTRKDHLVEHLRSYHHRDIPKRKRGKGIEEDQPEQSTAQHVDGYVEQMNQQTYYQSSGHRYAITPYSANNYQSNPYQPFSQ